MIIHPSKRDDRTVSQLTEGSGINNFDFLSAWNSVPDDNPTIAVVERTGAFVGGGASRQSWQQGALEELRETYLLPKWKYFNVLTTQMPMLCIILALHASIQ